MITFNIITKFNPHCHLNVTVCNVSFQYLRIFIFLKLHPLFISLHFTEYNHLIMTIFNVPFGFLHNTQTKTW